MNIQGYVPAVSIKGGRPLFVEFGTMKLTKDWDSAYCEPSEEAWTIARKAAKKHGKGSIHYCPRAIAVDEDGEPAEFENITLRTKRVFNVLEQSNRHE